MLRFTIPALLSFSALLPALLPAQAARYRDRVFTQVDIKTNIAFGSAVNRFTKKTETLYLDIYQPRGDKAVIRPAIVVVHGGGFRQGDKGGTFGLIAKDLAYRGFVAISINYRLKPWSKPTTSQVVTDAAHDFKASVRWLRRYAGLFRVDTTRIASLGSSAGAMTVLKAAYVSGEGMSGNAGFSSAQQALVDLWGRLYDVKVMGKGETPLCIIHGTKDLIVPFQNATDLQKQAKLVGLSYEFHPLAGAGHGPWKLYFQFLPDMLAFYWEQMALGQLAGLQARAGYKAPGFLYLDHFAIATDMTVLYVSPGNPARPIPGLGLLCVDPANMVWVQVRKYPKWPRLPTLPFSIFIPADLKGHRFFWQALHITSNSSMRLLSNCVTTRF